jgi:biopolymer transport protein TolR
MAASLDAGDDGGVRKKRGRGRKRRRPMAEINVTPMVDVMLVLLIIFMVTAPLLTVGVPVELPKSEAKQLSRTKDMPLTVTVDKDGHIHLGASEDKSEEVKLGDLTAKLTAIADARGKTGTDEPVFIRGAKDIDYGTVMKVMGRLSAAGFHKVSLVTEVEEKS